MKKTPTSEEVIQYFVDSYKRPISTAPDKVIYEGDVFYSDITYHIKHVLKMKDQGFKMFSAVCDGLRARKYWVHS
jgi:hypothetical protein